jgi:hypothetical protein
MSRHSSWPTHSLNTCLRHHGQRLGQRLHPAALRCLKTQAACATARRQHARTEMYPLGLPRTQHWLAIHLLPVLGYLTPCACAELSCQRN